MPDPTPIPSASALARAVEASERNRNEIWNEAIEAAARFSDRIAEASRRLGNVHRAEEMARFAFSIRALRRDTPDAG